MHKLDTDMFKKLWETATDNTTNRKPIDTQSASVYGYFTAGVYLFENLLHLIF